MEVVLNVESDAHIHLFAGYDATLDWVGAFGGSDAAGKWTDEGFVLLLDDWSHVSPQPRAPRGSDWDGVILIVTLDDPSRLSSAMVTPWRADPLSQYTDSLYRESSMVDASGVVWSTWSASDGRWVSLNADSGSGLSQETSRFAGIGRIEPLAVGDAGLAAVRGRGCRAAGRSHAQGGSPRDGYELRYDEPDGGLTLWDLGRDAAVYEFAGRRTEAPEGARQVGTGKSYQLVFEDHNADELVRFTATDLEQLFGRCWWTSGRPNVFSTQASWAAGPFPEFREWIGWSADGVDWGWESIASAFNQCEAGTDISLAVGDDYVVALTRRFVRRSALPTTTAQRQEHSHKRSTTGFIGPSSLRSASSRIYLLHVTAERIGWGHGRAADTSPIAARVSKHRKRMRRQGLRPVQVWVADTRRPGFAAEARRQSAAVARSPHEAEDQAFIDAVSDLDV